MTIYPISQDLHPKPASYKRLAGLLLTHAMIMEGSVKHFKHIQSKLCIGEAPGKATRALSSTAISSSQK